METIRISQIQKHFWLLDKIYRNNSTYNIPVVIGFNGVPDINALEYALQEVTLRHELLQVRFMESEGEAFAQAVNPDQMTFRIETVWINEPFNDKVIHEDILSEVHKVFNLLEWPLFRIRLFIFSHSKSVLTIVFHHIIVDLHSKEIFAEDFSEFYNSFMSDHQPETVKLAGKYSDFITYSTEWLRSDAADKMRSEWKKYIPDPPVMLDIPTDHPRPRINTPEGTRKHFTLDSDLYKKAVHFAGLNLVKDFTFFLAVYAIMLYRLTGQQRIVIGVPLTNRRKEEFKDTFGCFVNIVPLQVIFDDDITGIAILNQVRQSLLRIHRMQEIPFLELIQLLGNTSGNGIFQAGFTYEPPVNLNLNNFESEPLVVEKKGAQLDLFLTLWEKDNTLNGFMEYSTLLFGVQSALHFIGIFSKIVSSLLESPDLQVSELDILTGEESARIMEWNNTAHEYSDNICLHQKFEQQVQKTPDAPAILYGQNVMSYAEFNSHANRMANHLNSLSVVTENIICVCMERSVEMMIALYGIHKAGAAYLPVDPEYPGERLEMILSDSDPALILTKSNSDRNIPARFRRIYLDDIVTSPLSADDRNPVNAVNSHNLAYLMYTSGSTGIPKGVMIEHHSVVNKLEWMQHRHPLNNTDTILLKTPVTFDVSVWELFWWMFNGARMAILQPGGERDPRVIIEEINSKKVTAIVFVPSMFSPFLGYIKSRNSQRMLRSLRWVIQIGEPLTPDLVNSFNELLTAEFNPLLVNTYGPTEATVAVSWYDCPKWKDVKKIYIGKPIFNTKLLVLNRKNKLQPVGIPGELIITGVNLSRGYLNRPELNSEKFIIFRAPDGKHIRGYKTGDLARLTNDGNIDFIGRNDTQVKIRGFRIELGEIESTLHDYPQVKSAAAIISGSPENRYIAAYVVLREKQAASSEAIKEFLATRLPDYMIPGVITIIDSMPLNTSGKIDRKSLPDPVFMRVRESLDNASSVERKLHAIWKETLGLEEVGLNMNFFDAGGNSLTAIHMVNLLKQKFDISLEPLDIMEYSTIKAIAAFIAGNGNESHVKPGEKSEAGKIRKQGYDTLRQKRNELLKKF